MSWPTQRTAVRRMFRYELPVDDRAYLYELTGDPVHVAAVQQLRPRRQSVEFWCEHDPHRPARTRRFQVFGTGHPLPAGASWVGTAQRTAEGLVWHLYELTEATE